MLSEKGRIRIFAVGVFLVKRRCLGSGLIAGEYLRVWKQVPENPLVCMLIGLTFVHMSCKKDIFSRHMVALRVGFFK